jgi:hypothetical protein
MNMHPTTTGTDDTPSYPEAAVGPDQPAEPRQLTSEPEEGDPEEAGYGYGV